MRVCHFTSAHDSNDVRIFSKECISLDAAGYDVFLVAGGESFDSAGVHVVGIGRSPVNRLKRMTVFARKIYKKALELDCDIYHFHDPELLPFGLKLKRAGKIVIFDSHEKYDLQILSKDYLPLFARKLVATVYSAYEKYALKRIDAVIFVGTINGRNPFEGLCNNTCIVRNTARLEELYDNYNHTSDSSKDMVCYIGSLTENRGIANCIIASDLAGVKLILGGSFSTEEFKNRLMSMKEFGNVEYLGYLDRKGVFEAMSKCFAGLAQLPDVGQYWKVESLSLKVFEYMSLGIPVIIENSSFGKKVINKYCFGVYVDPDDPKDVSRAIRYLSDNPEISRLMGENGRKAIKEEFNWSIDEKVLLNLYEQLLPSNRFC